MNPPIIIVIGLQLVAAAMGYLSYSKVGDNLAGILAGIYAWGFWGLGAWFTCYPARLRDEFGDKMRIRSISNFSKLQTVIFLSWAIGVGAIFIYISEFRDIDNSYYLYCLLLSLFDVVC